MYFYGFFETEKSVIYAFSEITGQCLYQSLPYIICYALCFDYVTDYISFLHFSI